MTEQQPMVHRAEEVGGERSGPCEVDDDDTNAVTPTINVLHHVGGILRCRPAAQSHRASQVLTEFSDNNNNDDGEVGNTLKLSSPHAGQRPSLRAYSTPLFLHSPSFPPKRYRIHTGDLTRAESVHGIGVAADHQAVANTPDSARGEENHLTCSSVAAAAATATRTKPTSSPAGESLRPDGGYLHKYMGCVRERVIPFRAVLASHQPRVCGGAKDRARSQYYVPSTCRCMNRANSMVWVWLSNHSGPPVVSTRID